MFEKEDLNLFIRLIDISNKASKNTAKQYQLLIVIANNHFVPQLKAKWRLFRLF
jgi:hypothetical protein